MLKEAGNSIKRFLDSGVTELGDKLGPLLWQFAPFKKFDEADFGGFLELLPGTFDGRTLRHVIEVRHDSFKTPEFIALLRKFKMRGRSTPITTTYPNIADITGDFRLCAAAAGRGHDPDRLSAEADRRMGRSGCRPGRRARSRRTCRASMQSTSRRPRRATCLPT